MRRIVVAIVLAVASFGGASDFSRAHGAQQSASSGGVNPYLLLIRDPVVHTQLALNQRQIAAIRKLTNKLDGPLWSTRNKSLAEGTKILDSLVAKAKSTVRTILSARQQARLDEIIVQYLGHRAVLFRDVVASLNLTAEQTEKIHAIAKATDKSIADLQKQARTAKSTKSIEAQLSKQRRDEKRKFLAVLTKQQANRWKRMLGKPADLSKLGQKVMFKAPEIAGSNEWLNSQPLKLKNLRGQVVALHFYAFG